MPRASVKRFAGSIVSSATLRPRRAAASASAADTVVFPTPPPPRQSSTFLCCNSDSILRIGARVEGIRLFERTHEAAQMRPIERVVDDQRKPHGLGPQLGSQPPDLLFGSPALLDVVAARGDQRVARVESARQEPASL